LLRLNTKKYDENEEYGKPYDRWFELKTKEFSREFRKHNEYEKGNPVHHAYVDKLLVKDLF